MARFKSKFSNLVHICVYTLGDSKCHNVAFKSMKLKYDISKYWICDEHWVLYKVGHKNSLWMQVDELQHIPILELPSLENII